MLQHSCNHSSQYQDSQIILSVSLVYLFTIFIHISIDLTPNSSLWARFSDTRVIVCRVGACGLEEGET